VLQDPRSIEAAWSRIDPARRAPSPTALETLANCPFAFLVERVLDLGREPEPEDDWAPIERGRVFHEIVESVYRKLRASGRLPLDAATLEGALAVLDAEISRWRELVEREPPARRALRRATLAALRDDVAAVLARDAHRGAGERGVPTWFELPFGMPGECPSFALGGGARLPIRGKADRVDLRPDGSIEIVDFKTGAPRVQTGRVTSADGEKTSVHLQLPLYLDAVSSILGRRGARALFYHATADAAFEEVSFAAQDLDVRREPLGRLLAGALASARRGWFPCTPGDACCRRQLARACGPGVATRFRRKRSDPEVVEHLARLAACDPEREPA
jgi:ATP-dependent helicase/DNAse subunit B